MYTEGAHEAWCADFVSWIIREIGQPLTNPHSSTWRIPGVYSLRAYYVNTDRWQPAGIYTPTVGDVAIDNRLLRESHANIVIAIDTTTKTMITIDDNENTQALITKMSYILGANNLVGFGVFTH